MEYRVQDDGSGLGEIRVVIEDEEERYPKVVYREVGGGAERFEGEVAWDGRWGEGRVALPGEYYAWVKASDRAGNERRVYGWWSCRRRRRASRRMHFG